MYRSRGVSYESDNAQAGTQIRRIPWYKRDQHVDVSDYPARRCGEVREFLRLLDATLPTTGAQAVLLREEVRSLLSRTDPEVLFHDDLAEINQPVSITTFAAHAGRFDLQFLDEADYLEMAAEAVLEANGDQLRDRKSTRLNSSH